MAVEPQQAAACILVRNEADPEVLLAQRNPALRFMGGHHVFPGGRIQVEHGGRFVTGADDERHAIALQGAVREVFEETGLLCVQGTLPDRATLRNVRERLLEEQLPFDDILERFSLTIDAREFAFAGDWVTPTFSRIRFATRYFLHRVRDDQHEELIHGEMIRLDWMRPGAARRRWHRGEIHISTPVAYALQQLAATPVPQALGRLSRGTERAPGDHNRFEIRRGITLIPLKSETLLPATHTNCLLVGERQLYVIDPGAEDQIELTHLATQLDHLIELGARIEAVLLSHSHRDHTAGAEFVRNRYSAPILAHAETARQIDLKVDQLIHDGDELVSRGELTGNGCTDGLGVPPSHRVESAEQPGSSAADAEWRLKAIHTPGHDAGHLCFLEESTGALLAGDMVSGLGTTVVSLQYGGNMTDFIASLERLQELDCKLLIPSHGMPVGKPHEFIGKHLKHRLWREDRIKRAHEAGVHSLDALLTAAYSDVSQAARPWARHSLEAHLQKLGIAYDR